MKRVVLFPIVVLFAALVSAVEHPDFKELEYTNRVNEALRIFFPLNIVKQISNNTRPGGLNRADGTKCDEQVALLLDGITNGSTWALQMIDASSKIQSGILMGNIIDLGMFDECVEISADESGQEIRGRHCMYHVSAAIGQVAITETLSVCLPATCEPEDVERLLKSALELVGETVGIDIPITIAGGATCTAVDPPEWTAGGIVTLVRWLIPMCTSCVKLSGSLRSFAYLGILMPVSLIGYRDEALVFNKNIII